MHERQENKYTLPLSQLRQMEVIDISEGRRLGFISDIIFDDDLTKIEAIVIPSQTSLFSIFKKKEETLIKWEQIKVIGVDIILIDSAERKANIAEFANN